MRSEHVHCPQVIVRGPAVLCQASLGNYSNRVQATDNYPQVATSETTARFVKGREQKEAVREMISVMKFMLLLITSATAQEKQSLTYDEDISANISEDLEHWCVS